MLYRVKIPKKVSKEIGQLKAKDQLRIIETLYALSQNPFSGKKLSGRYKDLYSVRVWPYRIIYTIVKKEFLVLVVDFGHRQSVYKK